MVNPSSPRSIAAARRLTAPDALEQMEWTGKRGRESIKLLTGTIRRGKNACIGEREQGHRLRLTGSNAGGRRGKRGRAAASLDQWSRLCRRRRTAGFIGTTAAGWLRRLGCIVATATSSARRHGGHPRRLHGQQAAPARRKRQQKSTDQNQWLYQRSAHALSILRHGSECQARGFQRCHLSREYSPRLAGGYIRGSDGSGPPHIETRALSWLAGNFDAAAVTFDDVLNDGQA
jgi:hypothetical protein